MKLATQDLTIPLRRPRRGERRHLLLRAGDAHRDRGARTGRGKTTYFNLISGQLKATSGTVTLGGRDLSGASASQRTRAGLGRAFQLTNLFPAPDGAGERAAGRCRPRATASTGAA
jgi:ABC-type hemin transport system ATPase subunit